MNRTEIVQNDTELCKVNAEIQQLRARIAKLEKVSDKLNENYREERWNRYFPSVTNSGGHIHATTSCRTLRWTTDVRFAPELSGLDIAEAVETYDTGLCSVCFPSAPVALADGYVSKADRTKRDERAAEKAKRDDAKSLKRLTPEEVELFEVAQEGQRYTERIETVAKCLELVREPIHTEAELDFYQSGRAEALHRSNGTYSGDSEIYRTVAGNLRSRLDLQRKLAAQARVILLTREARREGSGATAEKLDKTVKSAKAKAAKDWA